VVLVSDCFSFIIFSGVFSCVADCCSSVMVIVSVVWDVELLPPLDDELPPPSVTKYVAVLDAEFPA